MQYYNFLTEARKTYMTELVVVEACPERLTSILTTVVTVQMTSGASPAAYDSQLSGEGGAAVVTEEFVSVSYILYDVSQKRVVPLILT